MLKTLTFAAVFMISGTAAFAVSDEIVESFPIAGSVPYGLAYDGSYFYITEYVDQAVLVVDPSNGTILNTLPLNPAPPAYTFLVGVAYDGTSLRIVTTGANKRLYQVNPANGDVLSWVNLPEPFFGADGNPTGATWDGTYVYISNNTEGHTYVGAVDPTTGDLHGDYWVSYAKRPDGIAYTQHDGSDYLFNVGNMDAWTYLYDTDGTLYGGEEFKLNVPGTSWGGGLTFAGTDTDLWMFSSFMGTLYHLSIDWSGDEFVNIKPASFGQIKSLYR
ncbi:MAG: hypothetical protein JSW52_03860 [Candidatus Coatesbacteria bacterium]|nr:MAG: hypothetical protein JSW52_03860 [Candidatus Coatesbacteria bacterium]